MRLRLDYGTDGLEVDLPDERVTFIEPMARPAAPDAHDTLLRAIRAPIGCPPLTELVRPGQRIAISVCDITRAQPRREMLSALFEALPQVRPADVTILIATGTHRANTPADGSASKQGNCANRVFRDGTFLSNPYMQRSARRGAPYPATRRGRNYLGLRVAKTLD